MTYPKKRLCKKHKKNQQLLIFVHQCKDVVFEIVADIIIVKQVRKVLQELIQGANNVKKVHPYKLLGDFEKLHMFESKNILQDYCPYTIK